MSSVYSQVLGTRVPRHEPEARPVAPEPSAKEAVIKLLDTESLVLEAIENLVKSPENLEARDGTDALLGDAMRRIAQARAVLHELRRAELGQVTIASVG